MPRTSPGSEAYLDPTAKHTDSHGNSLLLTARRVHRELAPRMSPASDSVDNARLSGLRQPTEIVRDMRGMRGKVLWVSAGCVAWPPSRAGS
jgi:hypothetical protein